MNSNNIARIRDEFPFFKREHPYIFFDNAATTQKPQVVIDRMVRFYSDETAPVFRSIYRAAEQATVYYEEARAAVATFIGARPHEIIFTAGATDGINAVALSWAQHALYAGDEIIISALEHSSNVIVWYELARKRGARVGVVPLTATGELDMVAFERLLTTKTRLVAITHSSNMLGTSVDVATIVHKAHAVGAYVLVDAAQSVPHQAVNVQQLACDFLVFSGHKILGPTGIGVLFVREALHDKLQPFRYGGGMFQLRHDDHCVWAKSPYKFEAGTPPIAQALGLAAALNYLAQTMSFADVVAYEAQLMRAVIDGLQQIARVRVLGPIDQLKKNGHVVSFVVDGIHAHDVAAFLDQQTPSVAVRAGQHCAQLVHDMLAIPASVRLSFYLYNTQEEIDIFLNHMKKLVF